MPGRGRLGSRGLDLGVQPAPQARVKDIFKPGSSLNVDLCNESTPAEQAPMGAEVDNFGNSWSKFEGGGWFSQFGTFASGQGFSEKGPIANLAFLMIFTVFVPFLSLMTTLAAFKLLSPMIGGDVEISLLSRLI